MHSILFLILAATNPEVIDTTNYRGDLQLWSDGKSHFIAVDKKLEHLFYGDGKTFYETSVFTTSSDGKTSQATLRDQRYDMQSQTEVTVAKDNTMTVTCGKRVTKMTQQSGDEAKSTLEKGAFLRGPHNYRPYALSRDDSGTYYFVDRGRYPDNERNFRVFIGPRGNMKEQKLKNIVHDSAGDIFATPKGDLRLIVGTKAEWVRESQRVTLVDLPIEDNVPMIYNELGAYSKIRLGTPCDDL